jgi:hypothetical protein
MIVCTSLLLFSVPKDLNPVVPKRPHEKQKPKAAPEENIAGLVHKSEREIHGPNRGRDFEKKKSDGDDSLHAPFSRSKRVSSLHQLQKIMFTVEL